MLDTSTLLSTICSDAWAFFLFAIVVLFFKSPFMKGKIGTGDKYSIFIVQNTSKLNAKFIRLNNPMKMWLEDKLMIKKVELIGNGF